MKRKQRFLNEIQILAPGDKFILGAAQHVPEERLPVAPVRAALELVVALQKSNPKHPECRRRMNQSRDRLSMSHALRIQSAHYWLDLGEADQALRELEALPSRAWNHPLAVKARVAALRATGETNAFTVGE